MTVIRALVENFCGRPFRMTVVMALVEGFCSISIGHVAIMYEGILMSNIFRPLKYLQVVHNVCNTCIISESHVKGSVPKGT